MRFDQEPPRGNGPENHHEAVSQITAFLEQVLPANVVNLDLSTLEDPVLARLREDTLLHDEEAANQSEAFFEEYLFQAANRIEVALSERALPKDEADVIRQGKIASALSNIRLGILGLRANQLTLYGYLSSGLEELGEAFPDLQNDTSLQHSLDQLGETLQPLVEQYVELLFPEPPEWQLHELKIKRIKEIVGQLLPNGMQLHEVFRTPRFQEREALTLRVGDAQTEEEVVEQVEQYRNQVLQDLRQLMPSHPDDMFHLDYCNTLASLTSSLIWLEGGKREIFLREIKPVLMALDGYAERGIIEKGLLNQLIDAIQFITFE